MVTKALLGIVAVVGLALGVSGPAHAAKPSSPDVQIVYEYSTPTEPPVPGTFAIVNYTAEDYWLCFTWTSGGIDQRFIVFLDEYAEPGHERTGLTYVDPGTTINLYLAKPSADGTSATCTKQKIDTFRVPR